MSTTPEWVARSTSPAATPPTEEPRQAIATACRVLARRGHEDFTQGHVAVRDSRGRGVWLKAAGRRLSEVTPEDVHLVDWDGEVIEGGGMRHGEWPIHTEVMLGRPDVNATVHTHPPYCIALAASGEPLVPVAHAGTAFVPPDVPRFDRTTEIIVNKEEARWLLESLGTRPAVFLVNHGIMTVADAIDRATMYALLLEQACYQQMLTRAFGGIRQWTADEEALRKRVAITEPRVLANQYAGEVRRLEQ